METVGHDHKVVSVGANQALAQSAVEPNEERADSQDRKGRAEGTTLPYSNEDRGAKDFAFARVDAVKVVVI